MLQLPARPSLEHLKQQAKDLLKAYHAKKTEVSSRIQHHLKDFSATSRFLLADAQTVIAREYGFPSWVKLKLHVDELKAATDQNTKRKLSARKVFVRELAQQLLTWSINHEVERLGYRFSVMPLRDAIAVRDVLVANDHLALLVDGLLEGLKHSAPRVRYNCAGALDHFADERCTEPLGQLLNDRVPRVRRAALHSLSCDACKVSPMPTREDLVDKIIDMAVNDASIRVRRVAAVSLAESCHPKATAALKRLSEENDALLQKTARAALKRQQTT